MTTNYTNHGSKNYNFINYPNGDGSDCAYNSDSNPPLLYCAVAGLPIFFSVHPGETIFSQIPILMLDNNIMKGKQ